MTPEITEAVAVALALVEAERGRLSNLTVQQQTAIRTLALHAATCPNA